MPHSTCGKRIGQVKVKVNRPFSTRERKRGAPLCLGREPVGG